MRLRNKIILGMAAAAILPAAALSTTAAYAEKDVNKAAPSVVMTQTTYSYDANNDGFIDPSEFTSYVTRSTDIDGDGYLENTEYESSSMTYFYDTMKSKDDANETKSVQSYTYWDKDKDSRLDSSEIDSLVANTGLYKKWDLNHDGRIDAEEFAMGTFRSYDDDKDGNINMNEWTDVIM